MRPRERGTDTNPFSSGSGDVPLLLVLATLPNFLKKLCNHYQQSAKPGKRRNGHDAE
jgi:hypothetical protein